MSAASASGAVALLAGAIRYALGVCALVVPGDMALPTPCADWDLSALRDRAAELLCAAYGFGGTGEFVAVGGLPMPAGLVACAGAVEIAVHGWDVAAARGGDCPIPPLLAGRLLRLCPFLMAGREGLFAGPVEVPAAASPGDKLVGYLGRDPGRARRPNQPRVG